MVIASSFVGRIAGSYLLDIIASPEQFHKRGAGGADGRANYHEDACAPERANNQQAYVPDEPLLAGVGQRFAVGVARPYQNLMRQATKPVGKTNS
jgi:hypothetical protein